MTSSQSPICPPSIGGVHMFAGAHDNTMSNMHFSDIGGGDSYITNNNSSNYPNDLGSEGDQSAPGSQSQDVPSRSESTGGIRMFERANRFSMHGMRISLVGGDAYTTNSNSKNGSSAHNTSNTGSQNQSCDGNADNKSMQSGMQSQSGNQNRQDSFRSPTCPPGQANYPLQAYCDASLPGVYDDSPQYHPRIPRALYSEYAQYGYFPPNQPPMLLYAPHPVPQPCADTRQYAPYPSSPFDGYRPREEYHHQHCPAHSPPPSGYYYPPFPSPRPAEFSVNMAPNHNVQRPQSHNVQRPQSQTQVGMDRFSKSPSPAMAFENLHRTALRVPMNSG